MAENTLVEVCGGIIFGLTRSVAEHYNPNQAEDDLESFHYNPVESTGLEWSRQPVDELICQEYDDREVSTSTGYMPFNHVRETVNNACSPEDESADRALAWKRLRPSVPRTIWNSMYFGFLISVLSAAIIGTFSILVYYIKYQTILVCLARPRQSIPIKIQWSKTVSEVATLIFIHVWFYVNTLFYFRSYQIIGLKRKLFLISFIFYLLDSVYRMAFQAFGISYSELTPTQRFPGNVIFLSSVCVQSWVLAKHLFRAAGTKKLNTFFWMIGSGVFTFITGILVANFIYPAYNKRKKTGKMYIAVFTPLITVVLKGGSRFCVQRLWRISHPGTSFLLLVPLYYGAAVMLRLLQVDLHRLKSIALIGVIHGIAEVIERSAVVLMDYICHQICERRRVPWGNFRSPRRERLATDIAIMSMLYEASAIISVNAFLHLHEYFYTDNKTVMVLLQSFAITTSVPLVIEWFFTSVSLAIETRYQNRPVMAVWRRQWKRHLIVAIINALPIAFWTSTSLFKAIQGRFPNTKDYCEMPFSRP